MNQLSMKQCIQVITLLVEGNSIRGTSRITGIAKNTIIKLLMRVGTACSAYHNKHLVNLKCRHIQCDEVWSYVYKKDRVGKQTKRFTSGDIWTWTALDTDTRLIVSWMVGPRNTEVGSAFIQDLASRIADRHRIQISTDGLNIYREKIPEVFGSQIDYAMILKISGIKDENKLDRLYFSNYSESKKEKPASKKIKTHVQVVLSGHVRQKDLHVNHVERQNLTIRTNCRRFTRRTNAFSKKLANHTCAVALHFMYYNFVRIHSTIRVTPAMQAGLSKRLWTIEDLINLSLID